MLCGKGASRWERKDGAFVNLGCGGEGGDCEVIFNVWCVVEREDSFCDLNIGLKRRFITFYTLI